MVMADPSDLGHGKNKNEIPKLVPDDPKTGA